MPFQRSPGVPPASLSIQTGGRRRPDPGREGLTDESTGEGNIQQRSAVGIRVYLSVGPGGEPPSSFTVSNLEATPTTITADVFNDGERALDVTGRLLLSDGPSGLSAGPFDSGQVTLAVDACGTITVQVPPDLPRGPWHAVLTVRSGRVTHVLEGDLTLPITLGAMASPIGRLRLSLRRRGA